MFVNAFELGIICNLGRIAGTIDDTSEKITMSIAGKILAGILTPEQVGHMLCAIVRK